MDVLAKHVFYPIDLIEVCKSGPTNQLIGADVGKGLSHFFDGLSCDWHRLDYHRAPLSSIIVMNVVLSARLRLWSQGIIEAGNQARLPHSASSIPHLFSCSETLVRHLKSSRASNEAVPPVSETVKRGRRESSDEDFRPASLRRSGANGAHFSAERLARPDALHGRQLFIEHFSSRMERDGCSLKVIFADANPQTQRQASSRKRVQAGDLFGQHGCTVERREQNGRHQADPMGGTCRCRKGNEWIIVVIHQAVDEAQA